MLRTFLSLVALLTGIQALNPMIEGAGVQLFSPDRASTLLVQGKSGKWGWTKGHRELTDNNWLETALREVHEESGFLLGEDYFLCSSQPRQWGKRLYWQGITFKQEPLPRHNTNEHLAIGWVSLKSIQNISLGYDVHHWMLFSNKIHCDF